MRLISKWSAIAMAAIVLGASLVVVTSQQVVSAQGAAGSTEPKMEDVFKNIKAFRGLPSEQLNPTMVFFEASLGVGCPYCHDADAAKRDLDTNPRKEIARRMIDMVSTVNKSTFAGNKRVTCFTCHMGRPVPIGVPNVTGEELPVALGEDYAPSRPAPAAVPTVTPAQVLDKYF